MQKCRFIKAGALIGAVATVSIAHAGDVTRVDLQFALTGPVQYWSADQGGVDPADANFNGVFGATQEAGRSFGGFGCSNADVCVNWNTGSAYANWASECSMAMNMADGNPEGEGWYGLASVFPGQGVGSETEGVCLQFLLPDPQDYDFTPFTYFVVDDASVGMAIYSTWNDGTTLAAGTINSLDTYYELAAPLDPACVDATGACAEVHASPGCDEPSCCALVCDPGVGGDPFCCDPTGYWDQSCVDLAVALCGIYQYECETTGASPPNDCVTAATAATNGAIYSFNTTDANTDGPDEVGCGSAEEDLPIWHDLWYVIEVESDAVVTATCCLTADFDTKIAMYNGGPIGTTYNPETLPEDFLACNEDCDDPTFFSSELVWAVDGGNQYFVRLGGYLQSVGTGDLRIDWQEPDPPIEPQVCDNPGTDPVSQSTDAGIDAGGVACAAGGITVANSYARVYSKDELGGGTYAINCINFGSTNSGSYIPSAVNIYRDPDGGEPGPFFELVVLASVPVGQYPTEGLNELNVASFGSKPLCVDLEEGETLVVEWEYGASVDGFVSFAGSGTNNTPGTETWIRSTPCGFAEFITMSSIGFPNQWYVELSGTNDCSEDPGCPGDFNDDGVVNGADFGQVLASWGPCPAPCPQDLNGDGQVNGADVGLMLSFWGPCGTP